MKNSVKEVHSKSEQPEVFSNDLTVKDITNKPIIYAKATPVGPDHARLDVIYKNGVQHQIFQGPKEFLLDPEVYYGLTRSETCDLFLEVASNRTGSMDELSKAKNQIDKYLSLYIKAPAVEDINMYCKQLTPDQVNLQFVEYYLNRFQGIQEDCLNAIQDESDIVKKIRQIQPFINQLEVAETKIHSISNFIQHEASKIYDNPDNVLRNINKFINHNKIDPEEKNPSKSLKELLFEHRHEFGELKQTRWQELVSYTPESVKESLNSIADYFKQYHSMMYKRLEVMEKAQLFYYQEWGENIPLNSVRNSLKKDLGLLNKDLNSAQKTVQLILSERTSIGNKLHKHISKGYGEKFNVKLSSDKITQKVADALKINPGSIGYNVLHKAVKTVNSQAKEAALSL